MAIDVENPELQQSPIDGVSIVTNPLDKRWMDGVLVEADVFIEKGYVASPDELALEYEKYLPMTEFAAVYRDGVIAGSTRLIYYDAEIGFKTLSDIVEGRLVVDEAGGQAIAELDLAHTVEVGTLAVEKDLRSRPEDGGRVSIDLYGAIFGESWHHKAPNVLASFDEEYFYNFQAIFGPAVKQLGPAVDYMGSMTVPALMDAEAVVAHLGNTMPEVHSKLVEVARQTQHD
jgi:hypothetical protein